MQYTSPTLGFEATYRFSSQLAVIQDIIDNEDDNLLQDIVGSNHFMSKCHGMKLSLFDLCNIDIDDSNIEIKTQIIEPKNRKRLLSQFTRLNKVLSGYYLVPSTISHNNNREGGGHIHLGYEDHADEYAMPYVQNYAQYFLCFVGDMLVNMNNIVNTYPSLIWAMNSPYDNINAHSSLYNLKFNDGISALKKRDDSYHSTLRYVEGQFGLSKKNFAIIHRDGYKTFEFRFFTMPKDVDGLNLNINVAEKLYQIAFEHTVSGNEIKPTYTELEQFLNITETEAVNNLKECAKYLGIDYKEFVKHDRVKSLRKRFKLERTYNPDKLITQTYLK